MSKLKKILIGIGVFIVGVILLANSATKGLAEVAQAQLAALRAGDVAGAYAYTSSDFQKATSLEDFKVFLQAYPSLSQNKSASFTSREVENNLGTLKGSLKAEDGAVTPVEYKLVKENDKWKILNIQLNPTGAGTTTGSPTPASQEPSGGKIEKVMLNDRQGAQGVVDTNKSSFSTTTPMIYVSAYISAAGKGSQASAELTYLRTGDKIGPVANDLEEGGDLISSFSFSKPTNDWPLGDYMLRIFLSTGASQEVKFSVK